MGPRDVRKAVKFSDDILIFRDVRYLFNTCVDAEIPLYVHDGAV
jgi:hypothetical protein